MKTITLADGAFGDITDEQHEELVKWSEGAEEWPKVGDRVWFVRNDGGIYSLDWLDDEPDNACKKQGNFYKTRGEAKMGAIRDRAFRVKNSAKKGDSFYVWNFGYAGVGLYELEHWDNGATQPKFATPEEAASWGSEYAEAIIFFNK